MIGPFNGVTNAKCRKYGHLSFISFYSYYNNAVYRDILQQNATEDGFIEYITHIYIVCVIHFSI